MFTYIEFTPNEIMSHVQHISAVVPNEQWWHIGYSVVVGYFAEIILILEFLLKVLSCALLDLQTNLQNSEKCFD